MVNQQTLQGQWHELRGKLRNKWGELTGDDVKTFSGNVEQLVGLIERKTGEARGSIEQYLEEITSNSSSSVAQAAENVRDYATHVAQETSKRATEAAQAVRQGYGDVQQVIRRRPGESAAVCFGVGVIAGVLLGLVMHR